MTACLRLIKICFYLLSALLVVVVLALGSFQYWFFKTTTVKTEHRVIQVEKGESLYGLADLLQRKSLLTMPKLWVYYARFVDKAHIKAGEYQLDEVESPRSLLAKFKSGKVIQYKLTLVEGTTVSDVLKQLRNNEKLVKEIPADFDIEMPRSFGFDAEHLEGWLFPDTYYYAAGDSDLSLMLRAYNKMKIVLEQEWQNRDPGLPLESAYEALILASIVEKETGAPHERAEIAGVFIRRLLRGMRLQTDPTVIYGMGEKYKGNITRADLRTATAYNTYRIDGLPPTPIALAGREAIHAVLHPAEGESLYFVAKGDGTHYFSQTLDEHIAAVKKYQLTRKENYRSDFRQSDDSDQVEEKAEQ